MSVTIKDIMKLPCMKNAEIAAGRSGEDNVVTAVTVLEYPSFSESQDRLFHELAYEGSDIIITAFSSIAGEPGRLLAEIMSSHNVGEAGVIIYYFDLFVKKLDQAVIDYADEVGYPIIVMPRDQFQLRYSEAISEIQELILEDRNRTENFAPAIMDTFMSLPRSQQNVTSLLRLLSTYLHLTFLMTEADMSLTAFSGWPTILEREADELLRRITAGTFSDPYYVIDLDGPPGRSARLIVISPGQPVKSSVLGHITDVTRLLLKVLAEESPEAVRASQLIRAIVGDEPVKMHRLAKDLEIRTENLRNMILYRKPHPLPASDRIILEEVRELLQRYCRDFIADVYSGEIVVLLDDGLSTQWLPSLRAINEALRRRGIEPLCAYAKNLENATEIKQAYQDISGSLEEGIELIEEALAAGKTFRLADFDEVDPEILVGTPYACGAVSPLTEEDIQKFGSLPKPEKDPSLLAFEAVEKSLGQEIPAVISTELGGWNTASAFFTAAMNDRIILDGDPAGRAVPGLQHSTYYLDGIPMYPMGASTNWGETLTIHYLVDDMRGEDILRAIAAVSQNDVHIVDHIAPAGRIGASVIRGAITRARRVGHAYRQALTEGSDLSDAVTSAAGGKRIFSGVMRENAYETRDGYTFGDMYITGDGDWVGHELHIWYQNENIMSWLDGEVYVTVPELIVVMNLTGKVPQLNPLASAGDRVDILCLPADKPWMTEKGLAVFGPKSFGFEREWEPFLEY